MFQLELDSTSKIKSYRAFQYLNSGMKIAKRIVKLKTNEGVILRSPAGEDAANLLEFIRTLHHESSDNLLNPPDHFDAFSVEQEREVILRQENAPSGFMISAFLENKIVGNLGFSAEQGLLLKHCGQLGMGVLKCAQGKGLGRILLDYSLEQARKNDFTSATLRVRTFNAPAITLYESLGFERVGTLKAVAKISTGLADEFIYQKILA